MRPACLLYGEDLHYLDHLAPLASLLDIPLIVSDPSIHRAAQTHYPGLILIAEENPDAIVANFNRLIVCTPRPLFDEVFFFAQALQNKRIPTIWCPHGNSDKGRTTTYMEALWDEECLLTYGPRIEDFLYEKGVRGKTIRVGNYRAQYHSYSPQKASFPTYLYAPTWIDGENSSSFPTLFPRLHSPKGAKLLVKLHPNLYRQCPDEIAASSLEILDPSIPLYPLFAAIDGLITDASSSVAYDFLAFNKPLLLLSNHSNCPLTATAPLTTPELFDFSLLDTPTPFDDEVFSPCDLTLLRKELKI